jgi:hypothetical protein
MHRRTHVSDSCADLPVQSLMRLADVLFWAQGFREHDWCRQRPSLLFWLFSSNPSNASVTPSACLMPALSGPSRASHTQVPYPTVTSWTHKSTFQVPAQMTSSGSLPCPIPHSPTHCWPSSPSPDFLGTLYLGFSSENNK